MANQRATSNLEKTKTIIFLKIFLQWEHRKMTSNQNNGKIHFGNPKQIFVPQFFLLGENAKKISEKL